MSPNRCSDKLLGVNAAEWYGVEAKLFVKDEAPPIERPDWFPQGPELDEWADLVAHPRENADKLREMGVDVTAQRIPSAAGAGPQQGAGY